MTLTAKFREKLLIRPDLIHLNNAGISPITQAGVDATNEVQRLIATDGFHAVGPLLERYQKDKETIARFIGCQTEDLAMMPNTSSAISQMAFGIHYQPGDEILQWQTEYPSNIYPWKAAAKKAGIQYRVIEVNSHLETHTDQLINSIRPETRVIALSWVQYRSGAGVDLKRLSQVCAQNQTWLCVDTIQGIGIIPFNLEESGVDAIACGTHKWLCAGLGHGFIALKSKRAKELTPLSHGVFTYGTLHDETLNDALEPWPDARRFEPGAPDIAATACTAASIQVLEELGIEKIYQTALERSEQLVQGLKQKNCEILFRGSDESTTISPIVTFRTKDVDKTAAKLTDQKISHALRFGTIRLSPHGFNTESEIQKAIDQV